MNSIELYSTYEPTDVEYWKELMEIGMGSVHEKLKELYDFELESNLVSPLTLANISKLAEENKLLKGSADRMEKTLSAVMSVKFCSHGALYELQELKEFLELHELQELKEFLEGN